MTGYPQQKFTASEWLGIVAFLMMVLMVIAAIFCGFDYMLGTTKVTIGEVVKLRYTPESSSTQWVPVNDSYFPIFSSTPENHRLYFETPEGGGCLDVNAATYQQTREGDSYRLKYTEGRFLKRFYLEGFAE